MPLYVGHDDMTIFILHHNLHRIANTHKLRSVHTIGKGIRQQGQHTGAMVFHLHIYSHAITYTYAEQEVTITLTQGERIGGLPILSTLGKRLLIGQVKIETATAAGLAEEATEDTILVVSGDTAKVHLHLRRRAALPIIRHKRDRQRQIKRSSRIPFLDSGLTDGIREILRQRDGDATCLARISRMEPHRSYHQHHQ